MASCTCFLSSPSPPLPFPSLAHPIRNLPSPRPHLHPPPHHAYCVVVQGAVIGCGVPALWGERPHAAEHAPAVRRLLAAGVTWVGQASVQPVNYPTLGVNIRNPAARRRAAGGGASGVAAAAALGIADLGVASDFMGSVRLPAACMGLSALVCTPGTLAGVPAGSTPRGSITGDAGASGNTSQQSPVPATLGNTTWRSGRAASASPCGPGGSSLEALAFLARDLPTLCRTAACLGLPGTPNLRHEITQVGLLGETAGEIIILTHIYLVCKTLQARLSAAALLCPPCCLAACVCCAVLCCTCLYSWPAPAQLMHRLVPPAATATLSWLCHFLLHCCCCCTLHCVFTGGGGRGPFCPVQLRDQPWCAARSPPAQLHTHPSFCPRRRHACACSHSLSHTLSHSYSHTLTLTLTVSAPHANSAPQPSYA